MNNKKRWIDRIQTKDIIAMLCLCFCFLLIAGGHNSFVSAITTAIVGYYFSKRVYEEKNNK